MGRNNGNSVEIREKKSRFEEIIERKNNYYESKERICESVVIPLMYMGQKH